VWLYFRFTLSFRDIEELLAARGIAVTYEAVRQWCLKFGQPFANEIRHRKGRPGDTWFLDEVFITINSQRHYLWRAVDQDGDVLDILVQKRRDKHAAKRFFRKLLKGSRYVPRRIVNESGTLSPVSGPSLRPIARGDVRPKRRLSSGVVPYYEVISTAVK